MSPSSKHVIGRTAGGMSVTKCMVDIPVHYSWSLVLQGECSPLRGPSYTTDNRVDKLPPLGHISRMPLRGTDGNGISCMVSGVCVCCVRAGVQDIHDLSSPRITAYSNPGAPEETQTHPQTWHHIRSTPHPLSGPAGIGRRTWPTQGACRGRGRGRHQRGCNARLPSRPSTIKLLFRGM